MWAMLEIYAGAAPQCAADATYVIGLNLEHIRLRGDWLCGGAVDISKFFDQLVRTRICILANHAGMPHRLLGPYSRLLEQLVVVNTIAGRLGREYRTICGLPQGGPLSMIMVALLMRTWVVLMKSTT